MPIKTLQDAFAFFSVPQNCIDYMVRMRWPDGIVSCPTCGSEQVSWLPTRSLFQCKNKHPKRQFSVKVGTVLEDSPISLSKWLLVMWMLGSCRNGISSYEVARTIGITQKSAWFMLHRLREAMKADGLQLSGEVEIDEAYVGGQTKNQHVRCRKQGYQKDKTPVLGMVERGGQVLAKVLPTATKSEIFPVIAAGVKNKATVYTDNAAVYDHLRWMGKSLQHHIINHTADRYVAGTIHTNTIENFWACLKRTLKGTYIHVRPKHLGAYVDEQSFRFNVRRGFTEQQRHNVVLHGIVGRRLTYKALVAKV